MLPLISRIPWEKQKEIQRPCLRISFLAASCTRIASFLRRSEHSVGNAKNFKIRLFYIRNLLRIFFFLPHVSKSWFLKIFPFLDFSENVSFRNAWVMRFPKTPKFPKSEHYSIENKIRTFFLKSVIFFIFQIFHFFTTCWGDILFFFVTCLRVVQKIKFCPRLISILRS